MEVWKDIEGYEGWYQVSNLGRIKSLERVTIKGHIRESIMSTPLSNKGYAHITLRGKDGSRSTHRVHRLVAQAFVPNPHGYKIVNHIDCDKSNNKASNLEWCTNQYNVKYAYIMGYKDSEETRKRKSLGHMGLTTKSVMIDDVKYSSLTEASKALNLNYKSLVCYLGHGKTRYRGHTIKYID